MDPLEITKIKGPQVPLDLPEPEIKKSFAEKLKEALLGGMTSLDEGLKDFGSTIVSSPSDLDYLNAGLPERQGGIGGFSQRLSKARIGKADRATAEEERALNRAVKASQIATNESLVTKRERDAVIADRKTTVQESLAKLKEKEFDFDSSTTMQELEMKKRAADKAIEVEAAKIEKLKNDMNVDNAEVAQGWEALAIRDYLAKLKAKADQVDADYKRALARIGETNAAANKDRAEAVREALGKEVKVEESQDGYILTHPETSEQKEVPAYVIDTISKAKNKLVAKAMLESLGFEQGWFTSTVPEVTPTQIQATKTTTTTPLRGVMDNPAIGGKIKVKSKATGQVGMISPQYFDPQKYEKVAE